jgi:hypothetical protein
MRTIQYALCAVVMFATVAANDPATGKSAEEKDGAWIPLITGDTLDGWTPRGSATWRIEDGVIIGQSPGGQGHLYAAPVLSDLEVRGMFRVTSQGKSANSGLYFRANAPKDNPDDFPRGYEAQISNSHEAFTGWLWKPGTPTGKASKLLTKDGEWFSMRIKAVGDQITIWVNDVEVMNHQDDEYKTGGLALQCHNDHMTIEAKDLYYRNLGGSLQVSNERVWNDEARIELQELLRSIIIGELRLAKHGHEEILDFCREAYIEDDSPENEWKHLIRFASDEIGRAAALIESERATWPEETDCDRLDRVETDLRERGILFWQASPCCDTCTVAEMPDRIDAINDRYPGFRDRLRGYAFFIDQNMPEMLSEHTSISVYLAYGWFSPDNSEVAADVYKRNALAIGHEVCEYLSDAGFDTDWDGDFSRKIRVTLNWLRRTMLDS